MLFRVKYRDRAPFGGVIGRGLYIVADCLEDAAARARLLARSTEDVESVRRFPRGEAA